MAYTAEDVISKIRQLKVDYTEQNMGNDPAKLPHHVAELNGYASIFYEHYAEYIKKYELQEVTVVKEENQARLDHNNQEDLPKNERMSVAEAQQRIDVRIGAMKAEKKRLEILARGTTQHINVCQSLMKLWQSEAKGIM